MDPDPDIFVNDLPKMPTRNKFFLKFFCLLLFEGTCTSFSKIRSQKEVTKKAVGIKVFLTFFAW